MITVPLSRQSRRTLGATALVGAMALAGIAIAPPASAVEPAPACTGNGQSVDCVAPFDNGRELRMHLDADGRDNVTMTASVMKQGFTKVARKRHGRTVTKKVPGWVVDPTATVWLERVVFKKGPDGEHVGQAKGTTGLISRQKSDYRACSDSNPSGTVCTEAGGGTVLGGF